MRNISFSATKYQVIREIAHVLHNPHGQYAPHSVLPLNFHVHLFFDRRHRRYTGKGTLTLPTEELGIQFLQQFSPHGLPVCGKAIRFSKSRNQAKLDIVENIRRLPYQDPQAIEERETRVQEIQSAHIAIQKLQFGWECRDHVFSSELEYDFSGDLPISARPQDRFLTCILSFDHERREIRLNPRSPSESFIIGIRFSQIQWHSAHVSSDSMKSIILFSLYTPPSFEREPLGLPGAKRERQIALDPIHAIISPYASLAIRLVCDDLGGVSQFRRLCRLAQLQNTSDVDLPVIRRGLFSTSVLDNFQEWLRELDWGVAFQAEALVRSLIVDPTEMLSLRPRLNTIIRSRGAAYAASLLRYFASRAKAFYFNDLEDPSESIEQCFNSSQEEHDIIAKTKKITVNPAAGVFECLHVEVTPTTVYFSGPFPERSNRVIRSYPNHHDCFLRVSFIDEDRLQYRFDRDVDGAAFTRLRVGTILREGLNVAGRPFRFLAYSQSALKEHAVWFVTEFFDIRSHSFVNASTIIRSLGKFDQLEFDSNLQYCPARYGARVSQAFTATDASISVEADEIFPIPDINTADEKWCFTDGVGTISPQLARDVWQKQRDMRKRARRNKTYPRAIQVRFGGSKGMLSVNHKLTGRAICLRPSMIKFHAPESREIEIAQAFDRPRKYYLNRPLIMILEHIGAHRFLLTPTWVNFIRRYTV